MDARPPKYHDCCRAGGHGFEPCEHEKRYRRTQDYVARQVVSGWPVSIIAPSGSQQREKLSWQVAQTNLRVSPAWPKPSGGPHEIVICRNAAVELYGWEMVTSSLIHEFGHCKLYEDTGKPDDHKVETEEAANRMGRKSMLELGLIPDRYDEHRAFFRQSYEVDGNWTETQCRAALAEWEERFYGDAP